MRKTVDDHLAPPPARPWLERVLKRRIIVHTKQDQTFVGVLMERVEDGIILRAAVLKGATEAQDVSVAGETWLPRENIAFAQLDE